MSKSGAPAQSDPFKWILQNTDRHRAQHGCWAYPFGDGPALGVLAAASDAKRIVECGTALGYTACWFAHGSLSARVDTIERDPEHVVLARHNIAAAGFGDRVRVIEDNFADALSALEPGYDIRFFDGYAPHINVFEALTGLLRIGGILVSANLDLVDGDAPFVCSEMCNSANWLTSLMAERGRTAVSITR